MKTVIDLFWERCTKGSLNECWIWKGNIHRKGYGTLHRNEGMYLAHRISYEIHHGPIPTNIQVLHHCDVPSCVNPHHLFLGTIGDNMTDKTNKNRQAKGERISISKLTAEQIPQIRNLYANGHTLKEIAQQFDCHFVTINRIVRHETWKHIP